MGVVAVRVKREQRAADGLAPRQHGASVEVGEALRLDKGLAHRGARLARGEGLGLELGPGGRGGVRVGAPPTAGLAWPGVRGWG